MDRCGGPPAIAAEDGGRHLHIPIHVHEYSRPGLLAIPWYVDIHLVCDFPYARRRCGLLHSLEVLVDHRLHLARERLRLLGALVYGLLGILLYGLLDHSFELLCSWHRGGLSGREREVRKVEIKRVVLEGATGKMPVGDGSPKTERMGEIEPGMLPYLCGRVDASLDTIEFV
ncbi:hypothetical protein BDY19DRAFT_941327 [Irpex rosettiformis]|uniref:Uncharacterized protein n=1 Tax=Irpex rosettiformis TaxID=378272 RepID=A0ACB8U6J5_9APHY|nr:hypothetical protein BDY19DRAFT_941327 [Irpex rosettiformis]